uniref:Uncharacterized protein n=1 Tax=Rhizophora mucronata TaxID=61149 RepID=A0A2P2NUV6_RHIMU
MVMFTVLCSCMYKWWLTNNWFLLYFTGSGSLLSHIINHISLAFVLISIVLVKSSTCSFCRCHITHHRM